MKPIKPKFHGAIKVDWKISKRTAEIVSEYSKYTKYDEDEIVDKILAEIIDDKEFVTWLKKKRFKKKVNELILSEANVSVYIDSNQEDIEDF